LAEHRFAAGQFDRIDTETGKDAKEPSQLNAILIGSGKEVHEAIPSKSKGQSLHPETLSSA
jgi:hypothetical protein